MKRLTVFLFLCLIVAGCTFSLKADQPSKPVQKPTKEELDKLFQDVKLPKGDPIPDFVEPPWVPPNLDKSKQNKRGTDFGPAISFTVQLDKKTFVRRGLTVRLPNDHAICYDLDTLGVAATWRGGFLDISATHFEDNKGRLPSRPGGEPTLWAVNTPGWADAKGSFADPRKDGLGPLPAEQVKYRGHFLNGYRVILSYSVLGRDVLEMPGVGEKAPPGTISRTFHVSASQHPVKVLLARHGRPLEETVLEYLQEQKDVRAMVVKTSKNERLVVGMVTDWPKGMNLTTDKDQVFLEIPALAMPLNLKVLLFKAHVEDVPGIEDYLKKTKFQVADLRNYVKGGPPRWKTPLVLNGKLGKEDAPYTVDSLALPSDNPWKSWIRPAAIDFFSDGRLAMSSINGDVWICSGINKTLDKLMWRRYATGLYEPLGLKIVNDKLYVMGRDRITRLHDLNQDGEADYYQTFYAGGVVAPGYHAFSFDLQTDSAGYFYFVKSGRKVDDTPGNNALIKVSPDGKHGEIFATGFRHPNGMGIGPKDEIVVGDNQGEFVPSSKINLVHKGCYYGYGKLDPNYARPLLWLPMKEDNSSGGQLWAPDNWGPLSGKMLHTSYGTCKAFYVLTQFDKTGPVQATAIPLPLTFSSGIMRGRVNPSDGQVYLSGLKGWGTTAKEDGSVDRVRYTGKPAYMVKDVQIVPKGIRLEFTCKLDLSSATNPKNYKLEQWGYIYSEKYGSPEMSVFNPGKKGHDTLEVKGITLGKDGQSVVLEVPKLMPVDQLNLTLSIQSSDGHKVEADLFSTIHKRLD